MEVVVRVVDREEAQDASSVHESEDRDERVDDTENDEVQACIGLTRGNREQSDDTAEEVDDVMDVIHFENTEDRILHVTKETDEDEHHAEYPRDCLCKTVHKKGGRK